EAHAQGFPGLEVCAPELVKVLQSSDQHPVVIYAVCRALIELGESEAADQLFQASQKGDTQLRMLIEPAFAKWGYRPAIDLWIKRLEDSNTRRRDLILACEGLSVTQTATAVPLLLDIAVDRSRPGDLRLSASRAAGSIATEGLTDEATTLLEASDLDIYCALALIGQDSGDDARNLLTRLASHANPAIAAPALRSLLNIDPVLASPFAEEALTSSDPKVRQCGLETYIALINEERLPAIAGLLNDPHPDVRMSAREALYAFSDNDAYREQILELTMSRLLSEEWRAQEQAIVLLVALDHKPAAQRLVELLRSERPEVQVTSAWGLRMLAVPETADGIIKQIKRESIGMPSIPYGDMQIGHLFEACAVLGERRALESVPKYIPRDITREKSRSAAIWASGKLLEDQPIEKLAGALMERVKDVHGTVEELGLVRQMSAITIGRMQAESQLKPLKDFVGDELHLDRVDYAIGWAIEKLSGERLPVASIPELVRKGWPLQPFSNSQ
ncbi:MAG: HEAT repeat domain-containing protein, partial [Planctomycetaceae bacterium]|nr:HEAT repeat domain-containing protein [Planctomycetaceae bacterium]